MPVLGRASTQVLAIPGRLRNAALAWARSPYALVATAYVLLRLSGFIGVPLASYPDTHDYKVTAALSIWNLDLFIGPRAWTLPLLYKVVPGDTLKTVAQLLISIACWTALGAAVARSIRAPRLSPVAFALVLAFSLSFSIIQWDRLLLSESLSISLTAALVAAWVEFARRQAWPLLAALLVLTLLWVFARDTNAYLALMTVPVVAVWMIMSKRRVVLATLLVGTCVIFAASYLQAANQRARWEPPLLDVIGQRILPDTAARRFFSEHGMPLNQSVLRLSGTAPGLGNARNRPPPELTRWIVRDGRSTYLQYLVVHPLHAVADVLRHRDCLIGRLPVATKTCEGDLDSYTREGRHVVPAPLDELLYPPTTEGVYFYLVLFGIAAAAVALRVGARKTILVPVFLIVSTLPHAAVVWHGDAAQVTRHALLVAVIVRLGLVLLLLYTLDSALRAFRDRRAPL